MYMLDAAANSIGPSHSASLVDAIIGRCIPFVIDPDATCIAGIHG